MVGHYFVACISNGRYQILPMPGDSVSSPPAQSEEGPKSEQAISASYLEHVHVCGCAFSKPRHLGVLHVADAADVFLRMVLGLQTLPPHGLTLITHWIQQRVHGGPVRRGASSRSHRDRFEFFYPLFVLRVLTLFIEGTEIRRSQDRFLRQKIERFFWRDFSGEELLPENSFLGQ